MKFGILLVHSYIFNYVVERLMALKAVERDLAGIILTRRVRIPRRVISLAHMLLNI